MFGGQEVLSSDFRIAYAVEENYPANGLTPIMGREATITTQEMVAADIVSVCFSATGNTHGRKTILLVEDDRFVRQVTAEVLCAAGYHLLAAGNASEAFELVRGYCGNIDLLLADIVMPGMGGRELAVSFRRLYPGARILLMSGYAEQFTATDQGGAEVYLAKPFSAGKLLTIVRRLLDHRAFVSPAVA